MLLLSLCLPFYSVLGTALGMALPTRTPGESSLLSETSQTYVPSKCLLGGFTSDQADNQD